MTILAEISSKAMQTSAAMAFARREAKKPRAGSEEFILRLAQNFGFKHPVSVLRAGQGEVVLRGLVPRIHVFVAGVKGVDAHGSSPWAEGPRAKPGHNEDGRSDSARFSQETPALRENDK